LLPLLLLPAVKKKKRLLLRLSPLLLYLRPLKLLPHQLMPHQPLLMLLPLL
jgi:hypothetical protein